LFLGTERVILSIPDLLHVLLYYYYFVILNEIFRKLTYVLYSRRYSYNITEAAYHTAADAFHLYSHHPNTSTTYLCCLIVYWSNFDSVHTVVLYYSEIYIQYTYVCESVEVYKYSSRPSLVIKGDVFRGTYLCV